MTHAGCAKRAYPSGYWTAFLRLQRTAVGSHAGVAEYYTRFLNGGGWVRGWQYGALAVRNMMRSLSVCAEYSALHLLHFSTPSLAMMDDRDELGPFLPADPGACPSQAKVPVSTALTLTEVLRRWPQIAPSGDLVAPCFHSFERAIRSISTPPPWQDMLFWDDAAPETSYTGIAERSYLATNYAAMRSDWSTSASMATLRAIAYSDKDDVHEHPDGGSLVIFQDGPSAPQSRIRTFEDRGGVVSARAERLADLYPPSSGITECRATWCSYALARSPRGPADRTPRSCSGPQRSQARCSSSSSQTLQVSVAANGAAERAFCIGETLTLGLSCDTGALSTAPRAQ